MSEKRVAVFIDWANTFRRVVIDVVRMRQFLEEKVGLFNVAYAYMVDFSGLQKETDPQEARRSPTGFHKWLRKEGFTLRERPVKVIKRGEGKADYHKANWDIGIAIDVLLAAQSGRFDEIVLFAGDSDFEDLILKIQEPPYFMKVTVISPGQRTAWEIRRCADRFLDLDEFLPTFSKPYEKRSRREVVEETAGTIPAGTGEETPTQPSVDAGPEEAEHEQGIVEQLQHEQGIPEF